MNKLDSLKRILEETRAVVFDFDNIIVDSEPYHFDAYSRVFARSGHTLDREKYWLEWTSRGGGAEGEIERHNLDLDPDQVRLEKDPIYSEFCRSGEIRPFPKAIEIIRAFKESGYTLAIASGSYERDIRSILSAHNAETLFSVIVGKDRIKKYKPHPETYISVCKKLGLPPGECLAIEDADKGIKSARAAGMRVILIETPLTSGFDLRGADLKLSSLEEFFDLLMEAQRQNRRLY